MISCKLKVKHNFKNIEKISSRLSQVTQESIEDVLKNIQGYAIKLEKGNHEDGILVEMIDSSGQIKGRVHTSAEVMPWAMFEHFGTGDYRELSPVGVTEHFLKTGGSEWFIPVSKAPKELHYPIIEIQGVQFYVAHGVKANHFMTDAEFKSRNENKEIVQKKISEMIKEVCR